MDFNERAKQNKKIVRSRSRRDRTTINKEKMDTGESDISDINVEDSPQSYNLAARDLSPKKTSL